MVIVWSLAALLDPASVSGAAPQPVFSWAKHSLPVASTRGYVRRWKIWVGGVVLRARLPIPFDTSCRVRCSQLRSRAW